jgi:hypothetical protein
MNRLVRGKKIHIFAGALAGVSGLQTIGVIDLTVYETAMHLLAALGFGALKAVLEKAATEIQGEFLPIGGPFAYVYR